MMSILTRILGDANEKYLKKLQPIIEKINSLEPEFEKFSDQQIKEKTNEFKQRLEKGESLDDILPEAFALAREAGKRTLNQRHYDVQMIGGIVLHQGKIAEMKTGEGKTLAATLPVYLNALTGKGVHVVTVNDYLSKRDTIWMGQIYDLLGLKVGCIAHEQSFLYDSQFKEKDQIRDELGGFKVIEDFLRPVPRKEAYSADITYGTNNEFGFDYLKDNMVYDLEDNVQRGFNYAIIDEVDSILIDEARTPLIISSPGEESTDKYYLFAKLISKLKPEEDYEIDEKMKAATFTEAGQNKIIDYLKIDPWAENDIAVTHQLEAALRARTFFERDKNYVVKEGQIIIVDEFTGRLMPGRRWSGGLHQAVEAKEHEIGGHPEVKVQQESRTFATITFQNYFRLYSKLAGMTGTAVTSAEELDKVYKLEVIIIPTNKPLIRKELPDRIYKSLERKFEAVVKEIKQRHEKGQPVLVGTVSIERNEYLGKLLEREGILHQILNAKQHEKEGEIIAQAGKLGAVTIATNMAGRGVDIILGGNPPGKEEQKKVIESGGLHIIGTERHEARRIDNQLRGRAGRQGDPGSSQFFVSLEDDLMRIFGGDRIKALMETMRIPEDQPIEARIISKAIESAQSKVEGMNFDARNHILEYDDVMNKHREVFYRKRIEILEKHKKGDLKQHLLEIIKKAGFSEKDYEKREQEIGVENMRQVEKLVCLKVLDTFWIEHLENMEHLRDSVRLRAYGQQDPLVEYKREGHRMFQQLLRAVDLTIANSILKAELRRGPTSDKNPRSDLVGTTPKGKIGRNDPCPCGSGKKYKKCHGKI
ncbi:MAG: preprotein translocase subunit SecA [Candidatus Nealsonbacteria bacterium RBG_13_37_56]|uniref:Protein translocase subunit SecA n=1 Tax=Candidatus Nealsonbacteria bacterium RBG_13_37_56 TaxID=1801661 RepID=A0A1G2DWK9_9BACT|nr:MAG: preprotein translocase subunit SecA [Candidatus Nealsonbacteria bacterium RBG_13_37_56]